MSAYNTYDRLAQVVIYHPRSGRYLAYRGRDMSPDLENAMVLDSYEEAKALLGELASQRAWIITDYDVLYWAGAIAWEDQFASKRPRS